MNIKLLALIPFVVIIPFVLLEDASAKPTIAIMDFTGRGVSSDEAGALTDRLRTELVETGKYKVVEREMLNAALAEIGLQMTGCTSDQCIVAAGQILGAAQMVAGSISKVGSVYSVSARVVDVETGEIIKTATYDHEGDIGGLLKTGMRIVAGKLADIVIENIEELLPNRDDYLPLEQQPQIVKSVTPEYPERARILNLEGEVWIKALVDRTGKVRDVIVARPSGVDAGFEDAALKAAYQYVYTPAIADNQPVAVWVMYPVVFTLDESEIDPKDAEALLNCGIANADIGEYDRAISDYDKALRINPTYAEAFNFRGIAYQRKGLDDRAISDFDRALEANANYANAYYHKAESCEHLGKVGEAIQAYDLFIKFANPRNSSLDSARERISKLLGR